MSDINVTVQDEIVNIDVIDTPVLVNVVNSPGQQGPAGPGVPVGGTAGQVLAKNSSTNYDTVWVNQSGGVPYSGATGNVNIGEYELKAGQVTLDTSPTGTAAVGTIRWNDTTGTSETTLKGGNVIIKNGVDLVARVVNKVSPNTTLTKAAYQAVRISGAQGQRLAIALAQANNDTNSADTIGLVIETIPTNQEGFIMTVGQLEGINTTGSLQGETWVDGDVLYLSPTTAGAITNVQPTGSGHIVVIGYVEYAHANNGKIYVKVLNGWELTELHDTEIISPANNEALIYESSSALWKNKTIATALGYTPANAATTLTINGVTYDLSTSRTWTIAAGISGSGASGQVTYWTGASAVSGSNNLFWDNANGRLGIGTNTPSYPLHINYTNNSYAAGLFINNTNVGTQALSGIYLQVNGVLGGAMTYQPSNYILASQQSTVVFASSGNNKLAFIANSNQSGVAQDVYFLTFGSNSTRQLQIVGSSNNVIVNGTSDSTSHKFQVYGDTLLRGSGSTIATTALTVQNSSSTNLLRVLNDGDVSFGADAFYWDAVTSRLGIGTNAPNSTVQISGSTTLAALLNITNTSTAQYPIAANILFPNITSASIQAGSFYTGKALSTKNGYGFNYVHSADGSNSNRGTIAFFGVDNILNWFANGNVNVNSATDLGVRFGVVGDTILRGSGATSATTALTVQNSSSTNLLNVLNNGNVGIGNNAPTNPLTIGPATAASLASPSASFYSVVNGATNAMVFGVASSVDVLNRPVYAGFRARGTLSSPTAVLSGDAILTFLSQAFDGTAIQASSGISFDAAANASSGNAPININFLTGSSGAGRTNRVTIKATGQTRFLPLASAPSGAEAGDVYYDSTLNKLRVYTTAWETITSV